ncbi:helix-hairpin-helix domain-containing protein [Micromonospora echinofusca]|uniref:ComEA family DNA-binding protein n=1 Tax=Micromonospora echinofusca TaxID=47858 RepID=UPI000C6FD5DF|nr:helix-hairpin-helix domain-containing protein [Micromonospora sp. MSM11]MCL7460145.1 helix-hairpin-helix domain-containing protein [Micromonospora sp. MSM11]
MSDDDENLLRQPLFRLLDGRAGAVPPPAVPRPVVPRPAVPQPIGSGSVTPLPAVPPAAGFRPTDGLPSPEDGIPTVTPSRLPGPGACDPGRRGVKALAAVVVLGAAGWAWSSRPQADPVTATTSVAESGAAVPSDVSEPRAGVPGVGPVLAQRILDHRAKRGAFRPVSDLRQVDGIGDTRYEQLKDLVTV